MTVINTLLCATAQQVLVENVLEAQTTNNDKTKISVNYTINNDNKNSSCKRWK